MLGKLIIIIAVFIAVLTIIKLLKNTPKPQLKNMYWKLGLGVSAVLLILMAITGRTHWITALVGATLPFIRNSIPLLIRFFPLLQRYQQSQQTPQPSAGNTSQVETSVLIMTLDHDSNKLTGTVITGPFSGHTLDSLNNKQLHAVLDFCHQQDQESERLLISYLNHRFGENWQTATINYGDKMGVKDAFAMLGLDSTASKEEVIKAHRKIMQKVHPDHGGSDYLAAQVNQAKDILIKRLST